MRASNTVRKVLADWSTFPSTIYARYATKRHRHGSATWRVTLPKRSVTYTNGNFYVAVNTKRSTQLLCIACSATVFERPAWNGLAPTTITGFSMEYPKAIPGLIRDAVPNPDCEGLGPIGLQSPQVSTVSQSTHQANCLKAHLLRDVFAKIQSTGPCFRDRQRATHALYAPISGSRLV